MSTLDGTPLADETFEYRGLTFGQNCDIQVNSATGFHGYEVRTSDSDQPRGDGAIRGLDFVNPRILQFKLHIWEPDIDGQLYEQFWQQVRSAFRPSRSDDFPLFFKRPGQPEQFIRCRPIQLTRDENWTTYNRYGYPPVNLRAVDPRIYGTEEQQQIVPGFSLNRTGVDLPHVEFPMDWTTPGQSESIVQNDGNDYAWPLVRFYGPATGTTTAVAIENTTTGQVSSITTAIAPNQILTQDNEAAVTGADRLVVQLDGATRYASWGLPREPFALAPGDNTIRFTYTGQAPTCLMTWRSTSMD